MILLLVFFGIGSIFWAGWKALHPPVPFTRYRLLPQEGDTCRAEAWIAGVPGDVLMESVGGYRNHAPRTAGSVFLSHANGTSRPISREVQTPSGNCTIIRYHLLVSGTEADSLTISR